MAILRRVVWVLVAGLVLSGCGAATHSAVAPARTGPSSGATPTDSTTRNQQLSRALVEHLLQTASVPPDSTVTDSSPAGLLNVVAERPASPNLLIASRWWTSKEDTATAIAFLRSHQQRGLRQTGSGSFGNQSQTATEMTFSQSDAAYADQISLIFTIESVPNGIGIRADAEAVYLPPQPDLAALVPNTNAATVSLQQSGRPTIERQLNSRQAESLRETLMTLKIPAPGAISCPAGAGNDLDVIRFATTRGPVTVTEHLTGCAYVTFSDAPTVGLSDLAGSLDHNIRLALGLLKG